MEGGGGEMHMSTTQRYSCSSIIVFLFMTGKFSGVRQPRNIDCLEVRTFAYIALVVTLAAASNYAIPTRVQYQSRLQWVEEEGVA